MWIKSADLVDWDEDKKKKHHPALGYNSNPQRVVEDLRKPEKRGDNIIFSHPANTCPIVSIFGGTPS
jgi:hypothetical protein